MTNPRIFQPGRHITAHRRVNHHSRADEAIEYRYPDEHTVVCILPPEDGDNFGESNENHLPATTPPENLTEVLDMTIQPVMKRQDVKAFQHSNRVLPVGKMEYSQSTCQSARRISRQKYMGGLLPSAGTGYLPLARK